ncbi:tyrosine-protein kinase receptor torso-like isoform X2 [Topomyia yanbarensis]|uniref:tyrosine-protein kinase receptor torso-like isoform X2 n=1 Tax=Topomyia yanbarensis TaxID=2498891 RepID=UPI00273AB380|nr:tyrosine-protein kinase receptor torso-like isoform X2 [Topomyia yanbarensis]
MQVIILKYVQVLCITVFFSNNINCDKLLLHNEQEDQHLYKIGSCAAQCLAEQNTSQSNASVVKIENLTPNKQYNITATVLSSNREYIYVDKKQKFKTLPLDYTPGMITNIDVLNYHTNRQNIELLDAIVSWKPAVDHTCHYEILYYASHSPDFQLKPIDVQQPDDYRHTINSLKLNSEYVIAVRAKNTKNSARESELKWHTFHTPSCTDWHNSSKICAPEEVTDLRVSSVYLSDDAYQFNVTWDKPSVLPDYYIVKLFDLNPAVDDEDANSYSENVTGDTTNILIEHFTMHGPQYEVFIASHANNRTSTQSVIKPLYIRRIPTDHWNGGRLAVIILTPILTIGLMKIFISLICRRRAKIKRYEQRCEYFKELEQKAPVDPSTDFEIKVKSIQEILQPFAFPGDMIAPINDEMEIDFDQIKVLDILGEGAFGLVRKGILVRPQETYTQVAVKMLKECPSLEDIKEFRREIEVMKSVGAHPNVVCIVGHYTKNVNEMMLLTEYCSKGNLLNYMRCEWHKLLRRKINSTEKEAMEVNNKDRVIQLEECCVLNSQNNKKPENVFNLDIALVNDKKSLAYKDIPDHIPSNPTLEGTTIENRLYPLLNNDVQVVAGLCTNACKCQVDIVDQDETLSSSHPKAFSCNIKISDCECSSDNEINTDYQEQQQVTNLVVNQCYYSTVCNSKQNQEEELTSAQLVEFVRQIAVGMEFLARNKVVHRDLAARNVLVCENKIVKISDFGLSRDIYQDNLYRKTGTGKLPIKWLALESLTHQVYTSQSDVWAYGILLYEICTLGGNPYPSLSTSDLIAELKMGYRMEKPSSCSKELYDIMLACWNALPTDRPTFSSIKNRLDELVEQSEETNRPVIDLDTIISSQSVKSASNEHSYLKPVEC